MGTARASLFGSDDEADLDLSAFQPAKPARPVEAAVTKQAAEKAGFKSREPKLVPEPKAPEKPARRMRRTGRNVQFNLKATPETIAAFYAVADAQGWVLGEALEKAVELMRERYGKS